jgi:hypothetical protein
MILESSFGDKTCSHSQGNNAFSQPSGAHRNKNRQPVDKYHLNEQCCCCVVPFCSCSKVTQTLHIRVFMDNVWKITPSVAHIFFAGRIDISEC